MVVWSPHPIRGISSILACPKTTRARSNCWHQTVEQGVRSARGVLCRVAAARAGTGSGQGTVARSRRRGQRQSRLCTHAGTNRLAAGHLRAVRGGARCGLRVDPGDQLGRHRAWVLRSSTIPRIYAVDTRSICRAWRIVARYLFLPSSPTGSAGRLAAGLQVSQTATGDDPGGAARFSPAAAPLRVDWRPSIGPAQGWQQALNGAGCSTSYPPTAAPCSVASRVEPCMSMRRSARGHVAKPWPAMSVDGNRHRPGRDFPCDRWRGRYRRSQIGWLDRGHTLDDRVGDGPRLLVGLDDVRHDDQ